MAGYVIQGHFVGGQARLPGPAAQSKPPAGRAGAPAPLGAARAPVVQCQGGGASFAVDPARLGLARGGGQPLPQTVLRKMEAAFGADFKAVRVHVGPQAERIGALAFTTGTDIYFAPGRYQPGTAAGQQLLGHELAHVIQQRQGRVRGPGGGFAIVQDRALEAEANAAGSRVAAGLMPPSRGPDVPAPAARLPAGASVQRQAPGGRPAKAPPGSRSVAGAQAGMGLRAPAAPPPVVWSRLSATPGAASARPSAAPGSKPGIASLQARFRSAAGTPPPPFAPPRPLAGASAGAQGTIQRTVTVGSAEYKERGRNGHNPKGLVREMTNNKGNRTLRLGWQTEVKVLVKTAPPPRMFLNWDDILDHYQSTAGAANKKRKMEAQDTVITGLTTGVPEPARKRARTMAYESQKAMDSIVKHVKGRTEYAPTVTELEALTAQLPATINEINQTTNPAVMLVALGNSTMHRLDFNFGGVPVVTHGYESQKDRSVDAATLNRFQYGPMKIGDNVGSYSKALKRGTDIRGPEHTTLVPLEMLRIPPVSTAVAIKRDLYEQGLIPLSEAISQSSKVSNAEFVGAVNGASMNVEQQKHLRLQQVLSNHATLETYVAQFPDQLIGTDLGDGKVRTTPRQINQRLTGFVNGTGGKKTAKKQFRQVLKRANASVLRLDGYDSGSDVSDYDEDDYKNFETRF